MSRDSPSLFLVESSSGWFLQLRGCPRLDGERLPGSAGVRRGGGPRGRPRRRGGPAVASQGEVHTPCLASVSLFRFSVGLSGPGPRLWAALLGLSREAA